MSVMTKNYNEHISSNLEILRKIIETRKYGDSTKLEKLINIDCSSKIHEQL